MGICRSGASFRGTASSSGTFDVLHALEYVRKQFHLFHFLRIPDLEVELLYPPLPQLVDAFGEVTLGTHQPAVLPQLPQVDILVLAHSLRAHLLPQPRLELGGASGYHERAHARYLDVP